MVTISKKNIIKKQLTHWDPIENLGELKKVILPSENMERKERELT